MDLKKEVFFGTKEKKSARTPMLCLFQIRKCIFKVFFLTMLNVDHDCKTFTINHKVKLILLSNFRSSIVPRDKFSVALSDFKLFLIFCVAF